ncbi:transposase [Paraburkholderia aspalathi]|uniref:transposase n=1 Tax=Paraburkholderia aspalathi TaxID=1324617 RepID=UPI000AC1F328|nr:transposase [Paraburkholderia aspalathi]
MKTTKSKSASSGASITVVHPHAAAIDIGAKSHVVAVGPEWDPEPVRSFGSFTQELHQLAQWQSTGAYWIPAFEVLEAYGFEMVLFNARHVRNVPGRKTDASGRPVAAEAKAYGLLRASFRPRHVIATLRSYLRQRERHSRVCRSTYPAHAESVVADEPATASCRAGRHWRYRHKDHPLNHCRRTQSGRTGPTW